VGKAADTTPVFGAVNDSKRYASQAKPCCCFLFLPLPFHTFWPAFKPPRKTTRPSTETELVDNKHLEQRKAAKAVCKRVPEGLLYGTLVRLGTGEAGVFTGGISGRKSATRLVDRLLALLR
jgi:hypothetical protein